MVINNKGIPTFFLLLAGTLLLTGCPGEGDRLRLDEEVTISVVNKNVCFPVPDGKGYRLRSLAINPRGTPYKKGKIIFDPGLEIRDERVCIPPSFYPFDSDGQFYIKAVFTATKSAKPPRRLVAALDISQGKINSIRPTDKEILRPYSQMIKGE